MARTRRIKPEFWRDCALGECSLGARLLFVGTWSFADDAGGLAREAKSLKAQVFPYDKLNVEPLIQELLKAGLLIEYETGGNKYLHIKNFRSLQRINRPSPPRVPVYEDSLRTHGANGEDTLNSLNSVSTHRGITELTESRARTSGSSSSPTSDSHSTSDSEKTNLENQRDPEIESDVNSLNSVNSLSPPIKKVAETTEAEWRREAQEAMDRIQALYPRGVHNSNWTVALHHASCLVGDGFTTWAELVDAVERYRLYAEANGQALTLAAHNFFDPRKQHWAQRWDVRTEADVRREGNIAAFKRVFDNLPEEES